MLYVGKNTQTLIQVEWSPFPFYVLFEDYFMGLWCAVGNWKKIGMLRVSNGKDVAQNQKGNWEARHKRPYVILLHYVVALV